MTSRRARQRQGFNPWKEGEAPEPDDYQHAGDFPDHPDDSLDEFDEEQQP